jgi:hypothetical protein
LNFQITTTFFQFLQHQHYNTTFKHKEEGDGSCYHCLCCCNTTTKEDDGTLPSSS